MVPRRDLPDLMQLPASLADTRSPSLVGGESGRGSGMIHPMLREVSKADEVNHPSEALTLCVGYRWSPYYSPV